MGGGLAWLQTGDMIRIDLNHGRCDVLLSDDILKQRRQQPVPLVPASQTPWQEIYRMTVGQLDSGGCMELAVKYRGVADNPARHNH